VSRIWVKFSRLAKFVCAMLSLQTHNYLLCDCKKFTWVEPVAYTYCQLWVICTVTNAILGVPARVRDLVVNVIQVVDWRIKCYMNR
jgi:hypothetical protein